MHLKELFLYFDIFIICEVNLSIWDFCPSSLPFVRRMRLSLSGRNLLLLCEDKDKNPFLARSVVAGLSVTF